MIIPGMTETTRIARELHVYRDENGWPNGYRDTDGHTYYVGRVGDTAVFSVRLYEGETFWPVLDLWTTGNGCPTRARCEVREARALAAMLGSVHVLKA